MVVIQENRADSYGIWMDGNEPTAHTVKSLAMCPQMDGLEIAKDLRTKWDIAKYHRRARMNKVQLWTSLVSAYVEQQLMDAGIDLEDVDGFLLKPHVLPEIRAGTRLAKGPVPRSDRKRQTYSQIVAVCPDRHRMAVREAFRSIVENLYFDPAEPDDYVDFKLFAGECRRFLQDMLSVMKDDNAYNGIPHMSAVGAYRILP